MKVGEIKKRILDHLAVNVKDIVPESDPALLMEMKVSELARDFWVVAESKQPPIGNKTPERIKGFRDYISTCVANLVANGVILDTISIRDVYPLDGKIMIRFNGKSANEANEWDDPDSMKPTVLRSE